MQHCCLVQSKPDTQSPKFKIKGFRHPRLYYNVFLHHLNSSNIYLKHRGQTTTPEPTSHIRLSRRGYGCVQSQEAMNLFRAFFLLTNHRLLRHLTYMPLILGSSLSTYKLRASSGLIFLPADQSRQNTGLHRQMLFFQCSWNDCKLTYKKCQTKLLTNNVRLLT